MANKIVAELVEKTYQELAEPERPRPRSRISRTPNGYIFLVPWANLCLLRVIIRQYTESLPRSEYRLKAQLDDATRSAVSTLEEGYGRPTTSEYLTFLGYSEASLLEVKGDVHRSLQDGFLKSVPGSSLASLGIDLKAWHEALKKSVISKPAASSKLLQTPPKSSKGPYRNLEELKGKSRPGLSPVLQTPPNSFKFLYPPVDNLRVQDLTYEIFIELVNKSAWHLRKLVVSLEDKLNRDHKFYQVEQARIRSKLKLK